MITYLIARIAIFIFRILPLPITARIGILLGNIWYYLDWYRRGIVHENLRIAYGNELSSQERTRLARKIFGRLVENVACSTHFAFLPKEEILKYVTVRGMEKIELVLKEGKGVVCYLAHMGSWEVLSQGPSLLSVKASAMYRPLPNPHLNDYVRSLRKQDGLEVIEKKSSWNLVFEKLRRGEAVGITADQSVNYSGLWVELFGRTVSTSPAPAIMARRGRAGIVPVFCTRTEFCHWLVEFQDPIKISEDNADILKSLNLTLEKFIRRHPEDWLWQHERFREPRRFLKANLVSPTKPPKPVKVLIRGVNWLGDAVMTMPMVQQLKAARPDIHLAIAVEEKLADLWRMHPSIDEVLTFNRNDGSGGLIKKLKAESFDIAILLPNSFRSAWEVWRAGIPQRVGFAGHARRLFLTDVVPPRHLGKRAGSLRHQQHDYLHILNYLGKTCDPIPPKLHVPEEAQKKARELLQNYPGPFYGLNPGAEYGPAKRWFPDRFIETANRFQKEKGTGTWIIFGGPRDVDIGAQIAAGIQGPCLNLAGKTTLMELSAFLVQCEFLLTNDTGPMHLAAALGTRVFAIFGSTDSVLTGPLGPSTIIQHKVPCNPCFLRECPIDFPCMKEVTVEKVLETLTRLSHPPSEGREKPGSKNRAWIE